VKVDGSSAVFPLADAVADEFQKATRGAIEVTVGVSGTSGGFRRFARGERTSRTPLGRSRSGR
jgi:phosphate transport system substrate-binding protein